QYWDLLGTFLPAGVAADTLPVERGEFEATMIALEGQRLATSRDFDPATGKMKSEGLRLLDEASARELVERLRGAEFQVAELEDKPYTSKPYPPFTTSTMQQEANRKLGFTARRTMQVAQS